jgi:hypothetical protein
MIVRDVTAGRSRQHVGYRSSFKNSYNRRFFRQSLQAIEPTIPIAASERPAASAGLKQAPQASQAPGV